MAEEEEEQFLRELRRFYEALHERDLDLKLEDARLEYHEVERQISRSKRLSGTLQTASVTATGLLGALVALYFGSSSQSVNPALVLLWAGVTFLVAVTFLAAPFKLTRMRKSTSSAVTRAAIVDAEAAWGDVVQSLGKGND